MNIIINEASKYQILDVLADALVRRKDLYKQAVDLPMKKVTERDFAIPQLQDMIDQIS